MLCSSGIKRNNKLGEVPDNIHMRWRIVGENMESDQKGDIKIEPFSAGKSHQRTAAAERTHEAVRAWLAGPARDALL